MSRLGRKPLTLTENVKINISDNWVEIEGLKGRLKHKIHPLVKVEKSGERELRVVKAKETEMSDSQQGLMRTILANMLKGVTQGFEKVLEINGVGFRAQVQGKVLILQLGFSHPIEFSIPEDIEISVVKGNRLEVKGFDRCLVGKIASEIRQIYPPEPYKGKGIRYLGEQVRKKAGKAAVSVGAAGAGGGGKK